tara:strand:- start:203 stop:445 length:243 start_codon:yes stop_codon:yes gene_type:complete
MTAKSIPLTFEVVPSGHFEGKFYAHNPRTGGFFIADSYTKGQTTVITHIVKKNKSVITLGTKETRYAKKAQPVVEFPEEV